MGICSRVLYKMYSNACITSVSCNNFYFHFQDLNLTLYDKNPDLTECFQLSVVPWIPCIYLWVVFPFYLIYLKLNNRGYIMMSILNRIKTVRVAEIQTEMLIVTCKIFYSATSSFIAKHSRDSLCNAVHSIRLKVL